MSKNKKRKAGPGRNPSKIDWDKVAEFAQAGANGVQIAAAIGVHYDTLASRYKAEIATEDMPVFSDYLQYKKSGGQAHLMLRNYKDATSGKNTAMQIYMSKVWLGLVERREVSIPELSGAKIIFDGAGDMPRPIQNEADIQDIE